MAGKLQQDLKQARPFGSVEQEAFLNVLRTAQVLSEGFAELLKPFGISATQYNVLRILRGAGADGLACREVGCRMVTRDPDITRLLDRLEKQGLIKRGREKADRRVVRTTISPAGLKILEKLDEPVAAIHKKQFAKLPPEQLRTLIDFLEAVREPVCPQPEPQM